MRERVGRELGLRIRKFRNQLGLSQEALAHRVGRSEGWMLQVENGRTDPVYSDLVNLATALNVDISQLVDPHGTAAVLQTAMASSPPHRSVRPDQTRSPVHLPPRPATSLGTAGPILSGRWWAAWQTFNHGQEIVATQPIEIAQHGIVARITALERSEENVRGGYLWDGQIRICDNQVVLGWYTATEQNVRSRGTFYFVLHPHGNLLEGRWIGTSYDGPIISGWGAVAPTQDEAEWIVRRLKERTAGQA
jgi:transcriptional regulator with XRE-family HTH domain